MLLCLACYGDRLASLAEKADQFRLYRVREGRPEPEGGIFPPERDAAGLATVLASCGVDEFVCGGITGCCRRQLESAGVAVRPWVRGGVDEVLAAWRDGDLESLSMPGCGGPRCAHPGQGGRGHGNTGCGGMRARNQNCARTGRPGPDGAHGKEQS
jgi:predicted Fe-Mo cluster-binding NifX family protein